MLDQAEAAQDERAHHGLVDVRFGGQQAAELRAVQAHHLSVLRHPAVHQALAVVEQVEFAGELVGIVHGDDLSGATAAPWDRPALPLAGIGLNVLPDPLQCPTAPPHGARLLRVRAAAPGRALDATIPARWCRWLLR
ncbi:hypothetical protein ACFCXR_28055 [Streptomyces noursei]|uniref:hypothetical protein n=1 Tax=Streptomyces noursei TaxID=1971 RepID=UPI0035E39702